MGAYSEHIRLTSIRSHCVCFMLCKLLFFLPIALACLKAPYDASHLPNEVTTSLARFSHMSDAELAHRLADVSLEASKTEAALLVLDQSALHPAQRYSHLRDDASSPSGIWRQNCSGGDYNR